MQQVEHDPEERSSNGAAPRQSDADRPPVGEPLVVSRHNPAARPASLPAAGEPDAATARDEPDGEHRDVRHDQLDGRVALVTSAAGEMGSALATELVGRGARVLLVDDDLGALVSAVDGLSPGRAVPVRCDLGSDSDVDAACEFVSRSAVVDLVVHVAPEPGGAIGLDERYRTVVRGPLALLAGLVSALAPSPRVLVVGRTSGPDADAFDRAAPSLLLEHLPPIDGMRSGAADCGSELGAGVFAEAVVDLLARDDLSLVRATFGGVGDDGR